MDPDATLRDLIDAVENRDWDQVDTLAYALQRWLDSTGFPPTTIGPKAMGKAWHRSIAKFVVSLAKSKAKKARNRRTRK